ncbi:MAG: AAA family ATPase, partial [Leptolyngbya sp.]
MNDFFKGFEQLLELAKTLEEKAESGELKTNVQINARGLSSIPRQGNIPDIGVSRMNRNSGDSAPRDDPAVEEVIITP